MVSETIKNLQLFYKPVDMPGGWSFSHQKTLKTSELYYNSKFHSGNLDNQGYYKFFHNITKPACDIATKFIDLDTKDIILLPLQVGSEFTVYVLQEDFKQYMRDTHFPALLNDIVHTLPKYGSVVLKKSQNNEWKMVNIHNLRLDPSARSLQESPFVYEIHPMTHSELLKQTNWKTEELFARGKEHTYVVYECYTPTTNGWKREYRTDLFTKKSKDGTFIRGTEAMMNDGMTEDVPELILFSDDVKTLPFRELHWERIPGRWLGYGFPEYLEDNQINVNETEYLERKSLYLKALQVWASADEQLGGKNVFTMQNGQILYSTEAVNPLQKDYNDLTAFNNAHAKWSANTERKTFTTDITTGANLPSRTPLGVANLQASLATSYFEVKRENVGIFLRDLIVEEILPSFKEKKNRRHSVMFSTREGIERVRKAEIEGIRAQAILDEVNKTGFLPSPIQLDDLELRLKERRSKEKNAYVEVSDEMYQNAQYLVDVITTGEQVDVGQKSQVYTLALQIVGSNPSILQNPVTRNVFFKLMELGGISPAEFANVEMEQTTNQQPMAQGGSVALPQMAQTPMVSETTKTF